MNDLGDLLYSGYKKAVPMNLRLFGESLLGIKRLFTEKDMTPEDLNAIRRQVAEQQQANEKRAQYYYDYWNGKATDSNPFKQVLDDWPDDKGKDIAYKAWLSFQDNPNKTSTSYQINPDGERTVLGTLLRSYKDPEYRVATGLGVYNHYADTNSVKDTYNWNNDTFKPGQDPNLRNLIANIIHEPGKKLTPTVLINSLMDVYNPKYQRPIDISLKRQK